MYNVNGMCKTKAFTLVELLVTIAIVAILSGIGLGSFGMVQKTSRDGKRKADLEAIRSALEIYKSDTGGYPATTGPLAPSYIASLPPDQTTGQIYGYLPAPALCDGVLTKCTSYTLCAALERTTVAVGGCASCGVGTCSYKTTSP